MRIRLQLNGMSGTIDANAIQWSIHLNFNAKLCKHGFGAGGESSCWPTVSINYTSHASSNPSLYHSLSTFDFLLLYDLPVLSASRPPATQDKPSKWHPAPRPHLGRPSAHGGTDATVDAGEAGGLPRVVPRVRRCRWNRRCWDAWTARVGITWLPVATCCDFDC